MFGSGVLTFMVDTGRRLRLILRVQPQRPTTAVVFAAVRGSTAIRTSSGALIVAGTTQFTGSASSAFVFPQDPARILFSGAAFSGHFSGSVLQSCKLMSPCHPPTTTPSSLHLADH
jgi:hypothetical protein